MSSIAMETHAASLDSMMTGSARYIRPVARCRYRRTSAYMTSPSLRARTRSVADDASRAWRLQVTHFSIGRSRVRSRVESGPQQLGEVRGVERGATAEAGGVAS